MTKRNTLNRGLCTTVLSGLLLAACGGGGDGTAGPDEAKESLIGGLWEGTATASGDGVFGIVLPDSTFLLTYGSATQGLLGVLHGTSVADADRNTVTVADGRDANVGAAQPLPFTFSGSFDASGIRGNTLYGGPLDTALSLAPAKGYSGKRVPGDFSGTWLGEYVVNGSYGPTRIAISSDGTVTGTADAGCRYSGALAELNATMPAVRLELKLEAGSCATPSLAGAGVALVSDDRKLLSFIARSPDGSHAVGASFVRNSGPTVEAQASTGAVGQPVTLTATATDTNGDALTYKWRLTSVPAGAFPSLAGDAAQTASFVPQTVGEHKAVVEVSDGLDSATAEVTIVVSSNLPPVIGGALSEETVFERDSLGRLIGAVTTITITATDPDGDPLTFNWTTSSGNIVGGAGASAVWRRGISFGRPLSGVVTATVTDGRGGEATTTIRFD